MRLIAELEPLTESQLLDHAESVAQMQRQCEVQSIRIAVHWALMHHPDRLDPADRALAGRERPRLYGGEGTPAVTDFAHGTLGPRLGVSTSAASALIADGLDLTLRLPRLWARVEQLEVKASYARFVARRTRELSQAQAAAVDDAVVEQADGRVPWSRFVDLVEAAIIASDPKAAAERERQARQSSFARPSASTEDGMRRFSIQAPFPLIAQLDARVAWFAEVLKSLGDERDLDERRVAAVALLTDPPAAMRVMREFLQWRHRPQDPDETAAEAAARRGDGDAPEIDWPSVLPQVRLYLHYYPGAARSRDPAAGPPEATSPEGPAAGQPELVSSQKPRGPTEPPASGGSTPEDRRGQEHQAEPDNQPGQEERRSEPDNQPGQEYRPRWDAGGVVRVEGYGPVSPQWVREFLGPTSRFTIHPVIDLAGQVPVDAYEVPVRHRDAVHLMTPADVFPWGSCTTRSQQIDHTVPFRHGPAAVGLGQSRVGNYGPMTTYHHRLKTHGGWQVQQPFPGIYVWRDPYGRFYLVDHTGTRRLPVGSSMRSSSLELGFAERLHLELAA